MISLRIREPPCCVRAHHNRTFQRCVPLSQSVICEGIGHLVVSFECGASDNVTCICLRMCGAWAKSKMMRTVARKTPWMALARRSEDGRNSAVRLGIWDEKQ